MDIFGMLWIYIEILAAVMAGVLLTAVVVFVVWAVVDGIARTIKGTGKPPVEGEPEDWE